MRYFNYLSLIIIFVLAAILTGPAWAGQPLSSRINVGTFGEFCKVWGQPQTKIKTQDGFTATWVRFSKSAVRPPKLTQPLRVPPNGDLMGSDALQDYFFDRTSYGYRLADRVKLVLYFNPKEILTNYKATAY